MRILISNDDGYFAPGIAALEQALQGLGEIIVVAPERDRSGASNSLTLDRPLSVRRAANGYFYVNGTPTDCVHVAVTGLLDQQPDLVVSGINDGANMGDDTVYSGTVAAATEAYLLGLPAIAFSLVHKGHAHLPDAARAARRLVERFIATPPALEGPILLNVNIPNLPFDQLGPAQLTRLGKRHATEPVIQAKNPRGETVYWIGPAGQAKEAGPGTDFHATRLGHLSVTPLQVDLTHEGLTSVTQAWLEHLNAP